MRQQLVSLLAELKQKWSLLIVSHDAEDLIDIADHCWTIDHGQLSPVEADKLRSGITARALTKALNQSV